MRADIIFSILDAHMFKKEKITQWFTNGKIMLATIATIIMLSITVNNQFKSKHVT